MSAKNTDRLDTWGRLGGRKELPELESARQAFAEIATAEIPRLVNVHQAWMVALLEGGNCDPDTARQILQALAEVDIDEMVATYDRRFTKPILQLERYLSDKIGPIASNVVAGRTLPPPLYRMKSRGAILPLLESFPVGEQSWPWMAPAPPGKPC